MLRRRLLAALPVVAIGAATALLVPQATAGAAPAATTGKTYVALGDSYAAGFGLPAGDGAPTGKPVAGCAQTTGDYPHLLAAKLGLTLTDVTCSGATTADFTAPQTVIGTSPPAQLDVFDTIQPDLVTITIGGNDLGFTTIAGDCLAGAGSGAGAKLLLHPQFASCKDYYASTAAGGGKAKNPYDKVAGTLAKVDAAIKEVKAKAPKAAIAVIAYPAIAPDAANTPAGGCFAANALATPVQGFVSALPFTDADVPYLQVLQQQLDAGIGAAATANGAAYADIYPSSLSHSACQPEATRWVEPIVPGDPGGTNVLHPNLAGTTAMADALAPVVTTLLAPPVTTPPASTPPASSAPASSAAGTTAAAGTTVPLADTGVRWPVSWLLGIAAVLLVSGAASVRLARPRAARHH